MAGYVRAFWTDDEPDPPASDGVNAPADWSFESVNDWVHHDDPSSEELGWTCLSLATALEKTRAELKQVLEWTRIEKAPLREQEVGSIRTVLEETDGIRRTTN